MLLLLHPTPIAHLYYSYYFNHMMMPWHHHHLFIIVHYDGGSGVPSASEVNNATTIIINNRAKRGKWIVWVNAAVVGGRGEAEVTDNAAPPPPPVNINIDNDDDGAEGEGVNNSGGGGNVDYNIDGGDDVKLHLSFSLSFLKFWKILVDFAAELRGVAYDLAGCIDKTSIFGLDTTINR